MRLWKLVGLAGLAGVAATGAVLARDARQRRAYTPDDVRARLLERHAALAGRPEPPTQPEPPMQPEPPATPAELVAGRRHRLARLLRRRGGVRPRVPLIMPDR